MNIHISFNAYKGKTPAMKQIIHRYSSSGNKMHWLETQGLKKCLNNANATLLIETEKNK